MDWLSENLRNSEFPDVEQGISPTDIFSCPLPAMNATARAIPILTFSKSHGLAHDCNSEASHPNWSRTGASPSRALLEETDLDVAEVCYRIGYEDPASFNRLFSRATGMPPGEYRKQSR